MAPILWGQFSCICSVYIAMFSLSCFPLIPVALLPRLKTVVLRATSSCALSLARHSNAVHLIP
jgi:hypothetical protein